MDKIELLRKLSDSVVYMSDEDDVEKLAAEYLEAGHHPICGITRGLVDGMNRAGVLYEEGEYFISDLILCSDAMYAGIRVLRSRLPEGFTDEETDKAVIGVVEGDTHDIGKNLVKIMLETADIEVFDLGRDVSGDTFIAKIKETGARILCLSTLMTTTMPAMGKVIERLKKENMRDDIIVLVGGGPLSQAYADKIGADAYAPNAVEAVKVVRQLLSRS